MEFDETQLVAARATAWGQTGEPLLTLEAARDWIHERGLVLFAPRAAQLPVPAPSLVEATLGVATAAPTPAETEPARRLLARLVGDGLALPLNLMGVPGDSPDFVVSAQVFSYVFTMRGDKAWKLPPSTTGAVRVSPLGLRVFEVLSEHGPMSAADLARELGREVTEAAVLRSLSDLWSQLRVLPVSQPDAAATLWELTSRRFTRAIKAGANAGQPAALSALISLYLAQVFLATEDDVMTFLSPLTARSRVRDVLHALLGARQLETTVLEGKTLLLLPGTLPPAAQPAAAQPTAAQTAAQQSGALQSGVAQPVAAQPAAPDAEAGDAAAEPVVQRPKKVGTGRIRSFESAKKASSGLRGRPSPRGASGGRPGLGPLKPSARYAARLDGKSDPQRRPFKRPGGAAPAGPERTFSKPWEEDRKARPVGRPPAAAQTDGFARFRRPPVEGRPPLGPREQAGLPESRRSAPEPGFARASRPSGAAKRPYTPRSAAAAERPPFHPRSPQSPRGPQGPRSFEAGERGARPGGFAAQRPYTPRGGGEGLSAQRPYTPRAAQGAGDRPYGKRSAPSRTAAGAEARGPQHPHAPRSFESAERGARSGGFAAQRPRSFEAAERGARSGGFAAQRPYTPRSASRSSEPSFADTSETGGVQRTLPRRPFKPRAADAHERPFTKAPWVPAAAEHDDAKRPYKPRTGGGPGRSATGPRKSFGGKPAASFGGKPAASFGGKPAGSFGSKPTGGKPAGKFGSKPAGKFGSKPRGAGPKAGGSKGGPGRV